MKVTLEGIDTEVNPEQSANADVPIAVTLEGIVTDVKAVQL